MARVSIQRPKRWDSPFGPDMSKDHVARALALPIFQKIDSERFTGSMSLENILLNDARVIDYNKGDVVVREGDYGSSVFFVLSGEVRVLLETPPEKLWLPRQKPKRRSWLDALICLFDKPKIAELRDLDGTGKGLLGKMRSTSPTTARLQVPDPEGLLEQAKTIVLDHGKMFGEIAALSRTPRTASIFAGTNCTLLEMRWQGLREIRRRDDDFKTYIDGLYRSRNLKAHLRESPLMHNFPDEVLDQIASQTEFETHGEFEWFSSFKKTASLNPWEVIAQEPLIAEEGTPVDHMILVRAGFARMSHRLDHGHYTVDYATSNESFGLREIVDALALKTPDPTYRHSLRAAGFVDILKVPRSVVETIILPRCSQSTLAKVLGRSAVTVASGASDRRKSRAIGQSLLNYLVDKRVINGTATMIIDTDRCTGCDDCVNACATTHSNNPRFIRHGERQAGFMFANACMHCVDPVCLIGCPTGAIHRDLEGGTIIIEENTCIGCISCAAACPYENIRMVEIRDRSGKMVIDDSTGKPILRATKCDLCVEQPMGPACERACPHDALIRINMSDRDRLSKWVNR